MYLAQCEATDEWASRCAGDNSSIEWTDATWNPVRGCAIVSKGCTNCYAMRQAHRSSGAGGAYEGLTKLSKGGPVWTGKVRLVPELLEQPLRGAGRGASS
jgi:protein gp37